MKRKHSETDGGKPKKEKKRDKSEKNHKKKKHKHKKRRRLSSGDVDRHDAIIGPTPAAKPEVSQADSINSSKESNKKLMMPMTKEQWEKEQNKISRVFDPETGRCRLVRGSGEIIEEIVSRGRQKEINKSEKNHKKKKHKHKKRRRLSSGDVDRHDAIIGPTPAAKPEVSQADSINSSKESNKKLMMPMTKEQWEKEQNKISRVFDPETGRCRLVRGSGEIIEEIVSRGRQKEINKNATMADGLSYQKGGESFTKN